MPAIRKTARQVWRSAQLYIGFHRDQAGQPRETAKVWPPQNARATIHADPSEQEVFAVVKAADPDAVRDVQVKFRPDNLVVRRDSGIGWEGIVIDEHYVSVQVNGIWVRINPDGAISHQTPDAVTYVEADGAVLKKTEFVEAMISGDGVELSRRTPDTIAAISADGVLSRVRKQREDRQ